MTKNNQYRDNIGDMANLAQDVQVLNPIEKQQQDSVQALGLQTNNLHLAE